MATPHEPGKPWTVEQIADRWGQDPRLVQKMLRERRLLGFHAGRDWRVTEASLDAYEAHDGQRAAS